MHWGVTEEFQLALERSLWEALAEGPILKLSFEASAAKKGVHN